MGSRSAVLTLPVSTPPISMRPAAELQLTCQPLSVCSWWLVVQPAAVSVVQLLRVAVSPMPLYPPHATNPSWVCQYLEVGRGGTAQGRLEPSEVRTSTDVRSYRSYPPVMRITEMRNNHNLMRTFFSFSFLYCALYLYCMTSKRVLQYYSNCIREYLKKCGNFHKGGVIKKFFLKMHFKLFWAILDHVFFCNFKH